MKARQALNVLRVVKTEWLRRVVFVQRLLRGYLASLKVKRMRQKAIEEKERSLIVMKQT